MFALCRVRESVAHSSRGAVLCGRQRGRRLRLAAAVESSVQSDADSCGDCAGGVCAAGTCSLQMPAYQSLACVGRRLLCFLLRTFYTRCNGKCVVVGAGPALLAYKATGSRS